MKASQGGDAVVLLETDLSKEITAAMVVRGYAYSATARIQGIDVLVDGATVAGLSYGQTRADICDPLAAPKPANCPAVGFQGTLSVGGSTFIPNGPHTLQVRARDEFGRYTLGDPVSITVNVKYVGAPVAMLESPKPNDTLTGIVKISGYAYWPGSQVRSATLYIDGYPAGAITYGVARADVCAALADVPACPRIGFEMQFDSRTLTNGPHRLGIDLSNGAGEVHTIPANVVRDGMNIIVQN